MIRSIRRRHKLVWITLALLLPVLFVAALALRHSEPVNDRIPQAHNEDKK